MLFREALKVGGPGIFFEIRRVAIAVESLPRCRRRRKKCDASTSQSNNFGVSRKRFKPSTPRSTLSDCLELSLSARHAI